MGYLTSLWLYILDLSGYLLLGLFFAGLLKQFISVEFIKSQLGNGGLKDVIKAALFGIPLPLCSCSVIPSAVTLKKSGASNGATSSFLIATPESGVDSIAVTYGVMDLPMTIFRPIAAFFSALTAGVLQNIFNNDFVGEVEEAKSCCAKTASCGTKKVEKKEDHPILKVFKFGYFDLLEDISLWLSIGILLGAAINFFVPESFFTNLSSAQAKGAILLIGVPFYICASASTPIAASMVLKGLSPGSALLFLLVGPATNISNISVVQKYIGKKGVIINIFAIVFVALGFSVLVDYLYEFNNWPVDFKLSHSHDHDPSTITLVFGFIFSALLLKALFKEEVLPRFKKVFK